VTIALVSRMVHREGGIQSVVWELAKRFAVQGHHVYLFTNSCSELPHPSVVVHKVPMLLGRSFRKAQSPWIKACQIWSFAWISRFIVHRRNFDIVHVHGDSLARADVRTAHSCHKAWIKFDLSRNSSLRNKFRKRFNPLHAILLLIEYYDYAMSGARQVISVSMSVKRQLMDNYAIDSAKVSVVPAGVECARFAAPIGFDVARFREQIGVANGSSVLVFVGWEFGRKGLSTILDAMSRVTSDSLILLVVGGGQERSFARQAEDLGIGDRVHFVGAQSDIPPFLWASDIFVFPTRYEPFGIVIAEAMAAGLPVITSRCAGAAEWIQDGTEGLLLNDPFDARELAQALDGVLSNPEMMVAMGKAAQRKARQFDWDRVAELTMEMYSAVLDDKIHGNHQ